MVEVIAPMRSRRLPFWAMIIALVICALAGVFVLLWFKLPTWAPAWVVEHSPWVDPIVRAVEVDSSPDSREVAVRRIVAMGPSIVPRMLAAMENDDWGVEQLVSEFFTQLPDDRVIEPMLARLLIPDEPHPRFVSSAPPAKDTWISPLRHQRAESMTGALLPHLRSDADIPHQVLDVAGGIDDPRIIEALRRLLHQPNQGVDLKNAQLAYRPTIRAAKALAESPCSSAIPALVESYAGNDATIRLRILCGILLTTDEGGQYREPEVDWDDRLRDLILAGITDGDCRVRQVAAMCLGMKQVAGSEKDLLKMTYADDPDERAAALVGLRWKNMSQEVQVRIVALLKDPDGEVCQQAVYATIMLDDPSSVTGHLLDLLSSPSERLRENVCSRLGSKPHRLDPRVLPAMIEMMGDSSISVARRAEATAWSAATNPEQKALVESASAELERRAPGPGIP